MSGTDLFKKKSSFLSFKTKRFVALKSKVVALATYMGTLKCVCSYLSRDIRANQLEHTLLRVPITILNWIEKWKIISNFAHIF